MGLNETSTKLNKLVIYASITSGVSVLLRFYRSADF